MQQSQMPFTVEKTESFYEKLGDWIGDVFYDLLPESGFDIRDEQIYMAFQLENAMKDRKVVFAEAGVGTGKTIVYLLYALCYARYRHQPAIIACADETLIEQLVKPEGDIAKLEKALNLNIDVRLAKSREQYLCLNKLDKQLASIDSDDIFMDVHESLPSFVEENVSMKKFTPYGDRKSYPELTDEQWEQIGWDSLQDCFTCEKRHRCGQTLHRDHYRQSTDIIICSHDFYMEHIWTKESRKREGQLPLLPEASSVVFDEGHLLEYAAQKALTYRLTEQILESLLTRLMANDVREKTLHTIEDTIYQSEMFFHILSQTTEKIAGSEKQMIKREKALIDEAKKLFAHISQLEEELVFESEMYVINEYELKVVEEYLEQISYSLSLFIKDQSGIAWFEEEKEERTLIIMPRLVEEIMREEVFSQDIPFIFSSATLSEEQSFNYIAKSLGVDDFLSFTVESPFDYENNMTALAPFFETGDHQQKMDYMIAQLNKMQGGSLLLFSKKEELSLFKEYAEGKLSYPIYFEGEAEISTLVSKFQNEEQSILASVHLWEGLDIPGVSLENVFIYSLPFPPNDPVFQSKREQTSKAFEEVDMPYMLLRMRQGIGRLIRTNEDHGTVHILLEDDQPGDVKDKVFKILPVEVNIR